MNMEHYTPTEEDLTAYALGEVDEKQAQAIEAALESQPESRALLDEIKETIALSEATFAGLKGEELTEAQRETVESAAGTVVPMRRRTSWVTTVWYAAAVFMVVGVGAAILNPALSRTSESSRRVSQENLARQMELERQIAEREWRQSQSYDLTAEEIEPAPATSDMDALRREVAEYQQRVNEADAVRINRNELQSSSNDALSDSALTGAPAPTAPQPKPTAVPEVVASDRFQVAGQPALGGGFGGRPAIQPVTPGTEAYERIVENTFKRVTDAPLSTFSIDVDTASYSNVRRFLNQAQMPPVDAVRIEELINYFDYDYPQPTGEDPFSANIEVAQAPWNAQHKLVRVGLKGKEIAVEERPATNLVFLLDVSGSMNQPNKLPLLKQSLRLLTEQLTENDRVAIAVYAGNSGLVLNSTPGNMHSTIVDALNRLQAGGSTNGGAGIQLAYDIATQNYIEGGVNRVILATDGDFNVGTTSRDALVNLIENKAKSGVFLSVLGFGMGNLKDATMEKLADKGNGNYAYIDTFSEAKKVLATEMSGTLFTIAKDVKIQVEFNPTRVQAYRLIGYENRALADRDFNDDTKDAGEIGAGHTVTALYEIVPTGVTLNTAPGVDALRYQTPAAANETAAVQPDVDPAVANELLTVKLRYKQPDGQVSKLLTFPVQDVDRGYTQASTDFKFATAVAAFGMKLRNSPFAANMTYDTVLSIGESGKGHDLNGYRAEFLGLVRQARSLSPQMVQRY